MAGLTPGANDMAALAEIIQPIIDQFEAEGINKIVVISHLQQVALEKELATLLSGIDVIFAGGSDVNYKPKKMILCVLGIQQRKVIHS